MAQPLLRRANTRLAFISSYRGVASYRVHGGPMDGQRVQVTSSDVDFLERDWNGGLGWNYSRGDYERDIIGGAGMITSLQRPVTDDVIEAYRRAVTQSLDQAEAYALHHAIEGMDKHYFAQKRQEIAAICTGRWDMGWIRHAASASSTRSMPLAA